MPTNQDKVIRKLRAILSADVKGYSLLMADDEAFTIKTLKEYRGIMSGHIQQHTGRVVDAPGDNMLAEFASAVEAVQCAVDIQKALKMKNENFPENKRLQFRIGVNIGDIVQDGDSIYGAGVNVAARIEGLADPGGICISRNAYDHIKDKLKFGYEYLGDHEVKNIKDPVRVYKVLMGSEDAGKLIGEKPTPSPKNWVILAAVVTAIVLLITLWQFYQTESESTENPSIAVLPFENMSNDPEQEYFSDGMTDELIGDLAKIKDILVITYADKPNEAIQYIKKSMRLNPLLGNYQLGWAYMSLGNFEKALASAEQSLALDPKLLHAYLISTVSNSHLGRLDEAKKALTKWLSTFGNEFYPDMQFIYSNYYFKNPEVFNQLVDGLVKAGFKKDSRGYFEVDEENKLNGQEIKKLVFGKTSIGNYFRFELRFQRSEEGKLIFSIPAAFMCAILHI
jgi:class 3 adenylate cyclase